MAKEQNIKVNLEEVQRNGHTVSVLTLGKQELGFIEPSDDRFTAFVAGSTDPNRFKAFDDAVNFLISEYHLHRG